MNDFTLPKRTAFNDEYSDMHEAVSAVRSSAEPSPRRPDQRPMQSTPPRAIGNGRVSLDPEALRSLRHSRMLSQQDLADDCERRKIRVSIATIKRAETGHAVRFRILRELARYFDVPFDALT